MRFLLPDHRRGRRDGTSTVVRRSMLSFAVGSLVTLVVVGVASVWVARDVALRAAMRDAAHRGGSFSRSIVSPLLTRGMSDGRVKPGSALISVLRSRMEDGTVTHIKLWDSSGRVVWADEQALVGRTFPLSPDVAQLFGTDGVVGDVTHLDKPENALEANEGQLLEVYAGAPSTAGPTLVVETYWSMERIDDAQWALLRELVPLVLTALLLFQLAVFPLARSLARRVDRGLAERELMIHHALSASELERRRIASQLHDGVIQDLAGIGFALPSIAAGLPRDASPTHELLRETQTVLKKDLEQLRTMLTDLHPSNLGEGRFSEAVEALAFRAEREGVRSHVQIATTAQLSPAAARMAYRIVREGVHNVLKHAHADTMTVTAGPHGTDYVVEVLDDGQGVRHSREEEGHMGLQLLGDTLADLGGSLTVTDGPLGGTLLMARFPLSLTEVSPFLTEGEGPGPRGRWSRFIHGRKRSSGRKKFLRSGGDDEQIPAPSAPALDLEVARDPRPARR